MITMMKLMASVMLQHIRRTFTLPVVKTYLLNFVVKLSGFGNSQVPFFFNCGQFCLKA